MKSIKYILLILLLLNTKIILGAVIINEVYYNPTGGDTGAEWIELYNNGQSAVDLTSYDLYPDGIGYFTFPSFVLNPQVFVVIHLRQTGTNTSTNLYFPQASGNMGNTSGSAALFKSTIHNKDTIVDFIEYGNKGQTWEKVALDAGIWQENMFLPNIGEGNSLSLIKDGVDNNKQEDWQSATPTPGQSNGNPPIDNPQIFSNTIDGKITEVFPADGSNGTDWIETYIIKGGQSIEGCKLYADKILLKSFPKITPTSGDYIIVHLNDSLHQSEDDKTGKGANGWWDVYSPGLEQNGGNEGDGGITNTDVVITLKNGDSTNWDVGTIVDAMVYAKDDWSGEEDVYNLMIDSGAWAGTKSTGDNDSEVASGCIFWDGSSTHSLQRKVFNNQPLDTNSKNDWTQGYPLMGEGYDTRSYQIDCTLEILQSPFSPYHDGQYSKALIDFNVPENYQVSLKIFDVNGRLVKTLLDKVSDLGQQGLIRWDGKNDDGNTVPVGIYIVYLEAVKIDTGEKLRKQKTVVVAKKLK